MKKILILILIFAIAAGVSQAAGTKKEKDKKPEEKAAPKKQVEMTKEDVVDHINMMLEHEEEVLNFIPEFKKGQDAAKKTFFTYQGQRLEEFDKEKLMKIYNRVQNEAVRIRNDRLQRQIESINQAQAAMMSTQQASQQRIPSPPTVFTAPQPPPQVPQPPPSPARIPQPPPQPPRPEQRR